MKKLILSNCNECPFVGNIEITDNKRSDYCYKVHKKLKSSKIPDWCPLEDAVLTSAIHSDGEGQCPECGHRFLHHPECKSECVFVDRPPVIAGAL